MNISSDYYIEFVNASDGGQLEVHVFDRNQSKTEPTLIAMVNLPTLYEMLNDRPGTALVTPAMTYADLECFRATGEVPIDFFMA